MDSSVMEEEVVYVRFATAEKMGLQFVGVQAEDKPYAIQSLH